MSRAKRRALLYGAGVALAAGLLFAGYGITVPPEAGTRLSGAALVAGLGGIDEALATCDLVLKEHPDNVDARVYRAAFLAMGGRHDEALLAYDEAIAHATGDEMRRDLVLDRASVLLRAGRTEEFRRERERLASMGAGHRLDVHEGLLAESEGAWGAAVVAYGKAHEARPADGQLTNRLYAVLLEQGREQLGAGRFDHAKGTFDRAIALLPRVRDGHLRAAEVCLATKDADGALEHLDSVGRKAPGKAPLAVRASTMLLEAGRRPEALAALEAAVVSDRPGTVALLQNEAIWRAELSRSDVRALLESEQPSTVRALTADGGVIHDPRTSGESGTVR